LGWENRDRRLRIYGRDRSEQNRSLGLQGDGNLKVFGNENQEINVEKEGQNKKKEESPVYL
jgi:hypothetical protein